MRLTRQTKFGLWALAAVVIAAGFFYAGTTLKPGEDPHYIFETDAPAYDGPAAVAATSAGGFTGFGETDGSNSRVVLSGRVVELSDTSLILEGTAGQQAAIEFGESPRILRLDAGETNLLVVGATVTVRLNDAADTVESILVLSQP